MVPSDHQKHEVRSLRFHQEVARMIAEDPDLLNSARQILMRWKIQRNIVAPSLLDEWLDIIDKGAAVTIRMMTAESEKAARLRQSSPFPCLLPRDVRSAIMKET